MSDPLTNSINLQADSISMWDPVARRYVDLRNSVAPQASTYTKNEVDTRLAAKADQAALDGKAEQSDLLALSADLAGKQDALSFAAPLSLSGDTLGVDYSGSALSVATIQTTGGLTLDAPGVIAKGDLPWTPCCSRLTSNRARRIR